MWTDASGAEVELDEPRAIEAEAAALAADIDRLFREVGTLTGEGKEESRREIRKATERLDRLKGDAERWNRQVELEARERAKALANRIRAISNTANTLRLVVSLHEEFERVSAKNPSRLAGEPSHTQQNAAALATVREAKNLGPSFVTAFEHLQHDPLFYRSESDEGGWFEWRDGQGVICRLASPLAIEREIDAIIGQLFGMIPKLEAKLPHFETVENLLAAEALWKRLSVLEVNLEGFRRESTIREDEEWECVKREWMAARSCPDLN